MICDQISILYQARHCYQEDIDEVVFQNSYQGFTEGLSGLSFYKINKLRSPQARKDKMNFLIGSSNYVLCDAKFDNYRAFKNLVPENNSYFPGSFPDKRNDFCFCVFMKEVYVLGGYWDDFLCSCLKYNFTRNKWSYIANMNESRCDAACTVFEGKIVVSGGETVTCYLKSVEVYDYHENKWTFLPDMIEDRCRHSLVSTGNKLFAIGGALSDSWEVFDSVTRKFSICRNVMKFTSRHKGACCVGEKIILVAVSTSGKDELVFYDVKKILSLQKLVRNFV